MELLVQVGPSIPKGDQEAWDSLSISQDIIKNYPRRFLWVPLALLVIPVSQMTVRSVSMYLHSIWARGCRSGPFLEILGLYLPWHEPETCLVILHVCLQACVLHLLSRQMIPPTQPLPQRALKTMFLSPYLQSKVLFTLPCY